MSAKPEVSYESFPVPPAEASDILSPPRWAVERVAAGRPVRKYSRGRELEVDHVDAGDFALVTVCLPHATGLNANTLQARVTEAYNTIAATIRPLKAKYPVRLWNHIPSIHERMDERRDRYMVFNAGRYEAFASWYGGAQGGDQEVGTGSGERHNSPGVVAALLFGRLPRGAAVGHPRNNP